MPIDYKKYPPEWDTEIRPRVLEREGNCCKFCGVKNHEGIFRGILDGQEVYQYGDGSIYSYPDGVLIDCDVCAPIEPISGDVEQQAIKVVLTIAHLDHDEENWDVEDKRLAALCQKCHLVYDAPEKKKRKREKKYKNSLFPIIKSVFVA